MRGAVVERRRADFDIPAPPLWVCSHIRGADAGGSAISWGQWWFGACGFEAGAVNWVLDPFLAERFLLPLRDRACVNACNDLCWSQFSARARPRMCERTFRKVGQFSFQNGWHFFRVPLFPAELSWMSIEIKTWIINDICIKLKDVITHACPYFSGCSAKLSLKLTHGWIITSHRKSWV